ncbi:S-layer protein [Actinobaculum suis]|uniref:S-layer protein n=1 Tax=Actinobaculum suis TaxID=1657 RepID=A0A7Z8Y8B5_9ACTO|nr:hypothetical protein [Actinobaculum suis]VDG75781.1 S-layer protein [Actinobaculum suis]
MILDHDLTPENLRVIASEYPLTEELLDELRTHPSTWPQLQAWTDYVKATGTRIPVPEPTEIPVPAGMEEENTSKPAKPVRRRTGKVRTMVTAVLVVVAAVFGGAAGITTFLKIRGDNVQASSVEASVTPASQLTASVAYGDGFFCRSDGSSVVECVGANDFGQLGAGHSGPAGKHVFDVGGNVEELVAGKNHACALVEGGRLLCWGDNRWMQAAQSIEQVVPPTLVNLNSGSQVSDVAAGEIHTCIIDAAGQVVCWGSDWHGELGSGTQGQIAQGQTLVDIGPGPAQKVYSLRFATCAVDDAGQVVCWGSNDSGRLLAGGPAIVGPTVMGEAQ